MPPQPETTTFASSEGGQGGMREHLHWTPDALRIACSDPKANRDLWQVGIHDSQCYNGFAPAAIKSLEPSLIWNAVERQEVVRIFNCFVQSIHPYRPSAMKDSARRPRQTVMFLERFRRIRSRSKLEFARFVASGLSF